MKLLESKLIEANLDSDNVIKWLKNGELDTEIYYPIEGQRSFCSCNEKIDIGYHEDGSFNAYLLGDKKYFYYHYESDIESLLENGIDLTESEKEYINDIGTVKILACPNCREWLVSE